MKILLVDDNIDSLSILSLILEHEGYDIISAVNGAEALQKARQTPPDLVISDILMPVMDGFTLCREWKKDDLLKEIPFIFYSAEYTDEKDEKLALKEGADKYIRKPVDPELFLSIIPDVMSSAGNTRGKTRKPENENQEEIFKLYNERLIKKLEQKMLDLEHEVTEHKQAKDKIQRLFIDLQHSNAELVHAYDATIEGWSKALDLRDRETEGHSQRVAMKTIHVSREMGIKEPDLIHIKRGALLHDMGKIGIPDKILLKPGPLTEEEKIIMRNHPLYAYDMLSSITFLLPALDIPYCHHEKWDGTGYPRGLKKEKIPLSARIFSIVDVHDALTHDRQYRSAWQKEKAVEYISSLTGTHFDPKIAGVFLRVIPDLEDLPNKYEINH